MGEGIINGMGGGEDDGRRGVRRDRVEMSECGELCNR